LDRNSSRLAKGTHKNENAYQEHGRSETYLLVTAS
jgi:hypothetical protein